jgi:hypothetical protein
MNKKTLIVLVALLLFLAAVVLIYFLIIRPSPEPEKRNKISNGFLENDNYMIRVPEGWTEEDNLGAYSMIINSKEQIIDPDAQKINFRSYYSVVYDALKDESSEDYFKKVIESLKSSFPGINIIKEEDKDTNGNRVHFIEAEIRQQNIDFAVLLAVNIKEENVWIISFNTLKSNWNKYENLFYEIAESFKIK